MATVQSLSRKAEICFRTYGERSQSSRQCLLEGGGGAKCGMLGYGHTNNKAIWGRRGDPEIEYTC